MFSYSRNTIIVPASPEPLGKPVAHFIEVLNRDRDKALCESGIPENSVVLCREKTEEEQYRITVDSEQIRVYAGDELGMIYALLYISEHFLGIRPFWFFMDQEIRPRARIEIQEGVYVSKRHPVRFRGWYINDEVLMMGWKYNENDTDGWIMALEALLRCGGNMVIPGTGQLETLSRNRRLASDMGLWVTHHHSEPLGAEMFARAYPGTDANYLEHEDLFYRLWEDAVLEQKDQRVVWNLCFRGQGDRPFWTSDRSGRFSTPESRGRLIGDVIRRQRDLVCKYVQNPVFCTNLYGEIMELYEQGYLDLDDDIIQVRADNGFGKMVTRRRGNHNPRVSSMPDPADRHPQGVYYHVSFYDLQAAGHLTQLPNSVDFVNEELQQVFKNRGTEYWIINCSNIRPHVYYLDAIRKLWSGESVGDESHSLAFSKDYFFGNRSVADCYRSYPQCMIPYGPHEDEHMGEQYYAENIRFLVHQFFADKERACEELFWIDRQPATLAQQVSRVCAPCSDGLPKLSSLLRQCEATSASLDGRQKELFDATIFLQAKIHAYCARCVDLFAKAYREYTLGNYKHAFLTFGDSASLFDRADEAMRQAEYGVWEDFYKNDCLADLRHTAYMIRKVMGVMRELGDSASHDKWQNTYCGQGNAGVTLLLFTQRHTTDQEMYLAMKAHK